MLRSFFRGSPPKYETLFQVEGGAAKDNPPSYEECCVSLQKKGVSKKKSKFVAMQIDRITSGKTELVFLEKTNVTPMDVVEYFNEKGEESYKDVYLLWILGGSASPGKVVFNGVSEKITVSSKGFFLVSRNLDVKIDGLPNIKGYNSNVRSFGFACIDLVTESISSSSSTAWGEDFIEYLSQKYKCQSKY